MFDTDDIKYVFTLLKSFEEHDVATHIAQARTKLIAFMQGNEVELWAATQATFSAEGEPVHEGIPAWIAESFIAPKAQSYFSHVNEQGVPYDNFDSDPRPIAEVKRLINAMHFAQIAFAELQSLKLDDRLRSPSEYPTLVKKYAYIVDAAYEAARLITVSKLDFYSIFGEELNKLAPLLQGYWALEARYRDTTQGYLLALQGAPLTFNSGKFSGQLFNAMAPPRADYDFTFSANLSGLLPEYLKKVRSAIEQLTKRALNADENLDQEKFNALQTEAEQLLVSIQKIQSGGLVLPFRVVQYVHAIRRILTISNGIYEEINHLSASSQETICAHLVSLKYGCLAQVVAAADKAEEVLMMTPGTLSTPVVAQSHALYEYLLNYVTKVVNFERDDNGQQRGNGLQLLVDRTFTEQRLLELNKRLNASYLEQAKARYANSAFEAFMDLIAIDDENVDEIMMTLKSYYQLFQPYVAECGPDIDKALVDIFNDAPTHLGEHAIQPLNAIREQLYARDFCAEVSNKIEQASATSLFTMAQIEDIKRAVNQQALEPSSENTTSLSAYQPQYDEGECYQAQSLSQTLAGVDLSLQTNYEDCFEHYVRCVLASEQAMQAKEAFSHFHQLLKKNAAFCFDDYSLQDKNRLAYWYRLFQPYWYESFADEPQRESNDALLVGVFNQRQTDEKLPQVFTITPEFFLERVSQFDAFIDSRVIPQLEQQQDEYLKKAKQLYLADMKSRDLSVLIDEKRRTKVIKHTELSTSISEFRQSLMSFTKVLSPPLRALIQSGDDGLPFPILKKENSVPEQAVSLMRLFNTLYHLEQAALSLEALDISSYKATYVKHLIVCYTQLLQVYNAYNDTIEDPHLCFLADKLSTFSVTLWGKIQTIAEPYQLDSMDVPSSSFKPVGGGNIWYPTNGLYVLPMQVGQWDTATTLSDAQKMSRHQAAKLASQRIQQVISDSDSKFKLFLGFPQTVMLFRQLRNQLNLLTNLSHDVLVRRLAEIKKTCFHTLLLQADQAEDQSGLVAGALSQPALEVVNAYFTGLLQTANIGIVDKLRMIADREGMQSRLVDNAHKLSMVVDTLNQVSVELAGVKKLAENIAFIHSYKFSVYRRVAFNSSQCQWFNELLELVRTNSSLLAPYDIGFINSLQEELLAQGSEQPLSPTQYHQKSDYLITQAPYLLQIIQKAMVSLEKQRHTLALRQALLAEKNTYLQRTSECEQQHKSDDIDALVLQCFDRTTKDLIPQQCPVSLLRADFLERLENFVRNDEGECCQTFSVELKRELLKETDSQNSAILSIDKRLNSHISDKIKAFNQEHGAIFQQLESLKALVLTFDNYLKHQEAIKTKWYGYSESEGTWLKKRRGLDELLRRLDNRALAPTERLKTVKEFVDHGLKMGVFLQQPVFSAQQSLFAYVVSMVVSFFVSLLSGWGVRDTKTRWHDELKALAAQKPVFKHNGGLFFAQQRSGSEREPSNHLANDGQINPDEQKQASEYSFPLI